MVTSPFDGRAYTAVQAVHHLSDILVTLASRTLGSVVIHRSDGTLVVPARRFADYLASAVGPIRRYGAAEPTVAVALLELMTMCAITSQLSPTRADAVRGEAALLLEDAERRTENPADLRTVHAAYTRLELALAS